MPGMGGYELLKLIKNTDKLKDIPVIMLTSRTRKFDRIRAKLLGADWPIIYFLLFVDNQSLIRRGLKALLKLENCWEIVGESDNGKTAIEQVAALQPNVVLGA